MENSQTSKTADSDVSRCVSTPLRNSQTKFLCLFFSSPFTRIRITLLSFVLSSCGLKRFRTHCVRHSWAFSRVFARLTTVAAQKQALLRCDVHRLLCPGQVRRWFRNGYYFNCNNSCFLLFRRNRYCASFVSQISLIRFGKNKNGCRTFHQRGRRLGRLECPQTRVEDRFVSLW